MEEQKLRNLKVTNITDANIIHSNSIYTDKLILKDTNIHTDINVSANKLKEMYEANLDTNCYNDASMYLVNNLNAQLNIDDKNLVINNEKTFLNSEKGIFTKIYDDIEYENIPDDYGIWCFNEKYGMIFKFKKNGICYFTHGNTYEYNLPVKLEVVNDSVSVNISTI